jgi:excinuclease UvrABC ATPase subunit
VDTSDSSAHDAHEPCHDHDETVEAHYASLERLEDCPHCFGSGVVVLTIEEDGQEHDIVVPCKRCKQSSRGER